MGEVGGGGGGARTCLCRSDCVSCLMVGNALIFLLFLFQNISLVESVKQFNTRRRVAICVALCFHSRLCLCAP